MLFDGTAILVTYDIVLENVKHTDVFRIISITIVDSEEHQHSIEHFKNITGPGVTDNVIHSHANTTVVTNITISNETVIDSETLIIKYYIYEHPVTHV